MHWQLSARRAQLRLNTTGMPQGEVHKTAGKTSHRPEASLQPSQPPNKPSALSTPSHLEEQLLVGMVTVERYPLNYFQPRQNSLLPPTSPLLPCPSCGWLPLALRRGRRPGRPSGRCRHSRFDRSLQLWNQRAEAVRVFEPRKHCGAVALHRSDHEVGKSLQGIVAYGIVSATGLQIDHGPVYIMISPTVSEGKQTQRCDRTHLHTSFGCPKHSKVRTLRTHAQPFRIISGLWFLHGSTPEVPSAHIHQG